MKNANIFTLLIAAASLQTAAFAMPAMPPEKMRTVDLRSFFHGDPPPPPKAPPPKQLAVVSTTAGVTPDRQVEEFMRAFADAIKSREGKPMLSRLSEKYLIDALPEGKKPGDFFMQAIETMPGPTEIIIKSIEMQNDIRTARIDFRYSADNVKLKTFRFDAGGKLLWSDLFALKRQQQGA